MNQRQNNTAKHTQRVGELRQQAREIADSIMQTMPWLPRGSKITVFTNSFYIPSADVGGMWPLFVAPYRPRWSLLRAGADAGYWTYPQRVKGADGQLVGYVVGWLGM